LTTTVPRTGYAPVNGLQMYYEIHGGGRPLLLLHGALSATETSFGAVLPALAEDREVISVEQQAHGRTADIDRPLRTVQMAQDTAALLEHIGIRRADVLGYSMGAGIALELAIRHPELVRKVVAISVSYNADGFHPGLLAGLEGLRPEHLAGTPWQEEYARTAPRPEDYPRLVAKVTDLNMNMPAWPAEAVSSIRAPVLIIIGDSDIVTPEHGVAMFRLLGGGVVGDTVGLPASQLAILPGTPHSTIMQRADLLLPMITAFLDAPVPGGG
jgi:pimeloyl-ACP methyl ester carboxylesterase